MTRGGIYGNFFKLEPAFKPCLGTTVKKSKIQKFCLVFIYICVIGKKNPGIIILVLKSVSPKMYIFRLKTALFMNHLRTMQSHDSTENRDEVNNSEDIFLRTKHFVNTRLSG